MRNGLLLVLVMGISVLLNAQTSARLNAQAEVQTGDRLIVMQDWQQAIIAYTNAIQLDPEYATAFMKRARLYQILGRYREAVLDYDRAIALNPYTEHIFDRRAKVKMLALDYVGAKKDFDEALLVDPTRSDIREKLVEDLILLKEYDEALQQIDTLLLEVGPSETTLLRKATVYLAKEDYLNAQRVVDTVMSVNPESFLAHDVQGLIHMAQGKLDEAVASFTTAINYNPDFALGYYNRAVANRSLERPLLAKQDLELAMEVNNMKPNLYFLRALIKKESGDFQGANEDYAKAFKLDSTYTDALYNRAYNFKMLGDYSRALEDAQTILDSEPDDPKNWNLLGNVHMLFGDYREAIRAYDRAISLDSKYPEALYNRGLAFAMSYGLRQGCEDLSEAGRLGYVRALKAEGFFCDF